MTYYRKMKFNRGRNWFNNLTIQLQDEFLNMYYDISKLTDGSMSTEFKDELLSMKLKYEESVKDRETEIKDIEDKHRNASNEEKCKYLTDMNKMKDELREAKEMRDKLLNGFGEFNNKISLLEVNIVQIGVYS